MSVFYKIDGLENWKLSTTQNQYSEYAPAQKTEPSVSEPYYICTLQYSLVEKQNVYQILISWFYIYAIVGSCTARIKLRAWRIKKICDSPRGCHIS